MVTLKLMQIRPLTLHGIADLALQLRTEGTETDLSLCEYVILPPLTSIVSKCVPILGCDSL